MTRKFVRWSGARVGAGVGTLVGVAVMLSAVGMAFGLRPQPAASKAAAPVAAAAPAATPAAGESAPLDPKMVARGLSQAFKDVAKQAEQSVVHIVAKKRQPVYERVGFFEVRPTGKTQIVDAGLGSGVLVSDDGYILTNNHVVAGADLLDVHIRDGRVLSGTVVGRDPLTDIAVVKVTGDIKFSALAFADSDSLEVGEWVVAIGSPFGFANTVTAGIVSAKSRSDVPLRELSDEAYKDFIQTDAAINPGNSGGPLLNLEGRIVGINSAIASRAGGSEGIGFAIPATIASAVMDAIVKNGHVVRGWLGATFSDLVGSDAAAAGLSPNSGVLVRDITTGSPASASLKSGDVVTRFQGRPMTALSTLRAAIALTAPGTEAEFEVVREGRPTKVSVTIGDFEAAFRADVGLDVRALGEAEARRMGYRNIKGVMVTKVRESSLGARNGVEAGDIILKVDGQKVETPNQFSAALGKGDIGKGIALSVIRGDEQGTILISRGKQER